MTDEPVVTMTVAPPLHPSTICIQLFFRSGAKPPKSTARYLKTLVALAALGGRARGDQIAALVSRYATIRQVHADMQTIRRQFGESLVPRFGGDEYVLDRVECAWWEVERRLRESSVEPLVGACGAHSIIDIATSHPLARHIISHLARLEVKLHGDRASSAGLSLVNGVVYLSAVEPIGVWIPGRLVQVQSSANRGSGSGLRARWPMRIVLLSSDPVACNRLAAALRTYSGIVEVVDCDDAESVRGEIVAGRVGAAYIDPFTTRDAVDLIAWIRDRHREVGMVLYGTARELFELPHVAELWRQTLQHYWRLPKDWSDESFAVTVEDTVILLFIYWLSGGRFGDRPGSVANIMFAPDTAGSWSWWRKV